MKNGLQIICKSNESGIKNDLKLKENLIRTLSYSCCDPSLKDPTLK